MKLIQHHESCLGLSLPAIGKYKIEFWYCPSEYEIKPHSHNNVDIKLMFLFGHNTRFFRCKPDGSNLISFLARSRHMFKVFNIYAGNIHWFTVSKFPLIFINFERWKTIPSSAAIDFQLVQKEQLTEKI